MAWSNTVDERYAGGLLSYAADDFDASNLLNNTFVLAADDVGYGNLTDAYATGDIDTYSLGILSTGTYSIDVDHLTWDYTSVSNNFGSVSRFELLSSSGYVLQTSYSTFSDISFTVTSQDTYYVRIVGSSFSERQYSVSYTKTGELNGNNPAIFGSAYYNGALDVGETITGSVQYSDLDGNSDNIVLTTWYVNDVYQGISNEYVITSDDAGKNLYFKFAFYDDLNNLEISGMYSLGVINNPVGGSVTINGTTSEGQELTAITTGITDTDGLTNATFTYQWQRDNTDITGATSSTYTLTQDDVGAGVSVVVSYTDDLGTSESIESAATTVIEANNVASGTPSITGSFEDHSVLQVDTSSISDADGLGSFSYQWLRDGLNIEGAKTSTYELTQADVGKVINVEVSFTDQKGFKESITSTNQTSVKDYISMFKQVAIVIDDFSPWLVDLLDDISNLTIYDYAATTTTALNRANGVSGDYTDYGYVNVDTYGSYDLGSDETYDYNQTISAYNSSTHPDMPAHGDIVLDAMYGSLSNATDLEVIALDWDFTDNKDSQSLFNLSTFQNIISDAFDDFWEDDTAYFITGLNASFGGLDVTQFLPVVSEILASDAFIVQAAPNTSQHGVNWGEYFPNVINVGAYNIDGDGYALVGDPTQLSTIDLLANGYIEGDWGWSFGTSFAAPRVFASLINLFDEYVISGFNEDPSIYDPDNAQNLDSTQETQITDGVVDAITSEVLIDLSSQSSLYGPIRVLTDTLDTYGIEPITVAGATGLSNYPFLAAYANNPVTGQITLSGDLLEGQTLQLDVDQMVDLDGIGNLAYEWYRNDQLISGAIGSALVLSEADVGKTISARVTFDDGVGFAESLSVYAGKTVQGAYQEQVFIAPQIWNDLAFENATVIDSETTFLGNELQFRYSNGYRINFGFDQTASFGDMGNFIYAEIHDSNDVRLTRADGFIIEVGDSDSLTAAINSLIEMRATTTLTPEDDVYDFDIAGDDDLIYDQRVENGIQPSLYNILDGGAGSDTLISSHWSSSDFSISINSAGNYIAKFLPTGVSTELINIEKIHLSDMSLMTLSDAYVAYFKNIFLLNHNGDQLNLGSYTILDETGLATQNLSSLTPTNTRILSAELEETTDGAVDISDVISQLQIGRAHV